MVWGVCGYTLYLIFTKYDVMHEDQKIFFLVSSVQIILFQNFCGLFRCVFAMLLCSFWSKGFFLTTFSWKPCLFNFSDCAFININVMFLHHMIQLFCLYISEHSRKDWQQSWRISKKNIRNDCCSLLIWEGFTMLQ